MGMILRIASSRIVGQGDIVGRSGYFSLNLSANSVMRGRLDARRTLKSLVADLRYNKIYNSSLNMEEGKIKNKLEADLMREICQENIEEGELIEQLLMLQKSKSLMQRRRGLKTEIESRLEEFVNKKKS